MKKQTAVEWLEEQMSTWGDKPRWMRDDIVKQAKEMEKEQSQKYAEFCVECDRKGMPLLDFKSWIEL